MSLDFAKCHFYDLYFDGDRKVPAWTHNVQCLSPIVSTAHVTSFIF